MIESLVHNRRDQATPIVLVVDDCPDIRFLFLNLLAELGVGADAAESAATAAARLADPRAAYRACLVDVNLGDARAADWVPRLVAPSRPRMIAMSAYVDDEIAAGLLRVGFFEVVDKTSLLCHLPEVLARAGVLPTVAIS